MIAWIMRNAGFYQLHGVVVAGTVKRYSSYR